MTLAYTVKLGLTNWETNVGAQKIDGSPLETHNMASARFSFQNSLRKVRFFNETFLLIDTSIEVDLGMLFLAFSNADIQFGTEKLTWRSYTAVKALPSTSWVELIDKKEFARAVVDRNSETFVVYVTTLEIPTAMPIHLFKTFYIQDDSTLAILLWDKALTEILAKYSYYVDIFSLDLAMELPGNLGMNEHTIELIDGK